MLVRPGARARRRVAPTSAGWSLTAAIRPLVADLARRDHACASPSGATLLGPGRRRRARAARRAADDQVALTDDRADGDDVPLARRAHRLRRARVARPVRVRRHRRRRRRPALPARRAAPVRRRDRGTLLGAALATVIGLPALRMRGLFLSVATLGFALATSSWLFFQELVRPQSTTRPGRRCSCPRPRVPRHRLQRGAPVLLAVPRVVVLVTVMVYRLRRPGRAGDDRRARQRAVGGEPGPVAAPGEAARRSPCRARSPRSPDSCTAGC